MLAFFVWLIAVSAADPVQERLLTQTFPIQVVTDANLVVLDPPTRNARVTVRASVSVVNILNTTPQDVVVLADFTGLGPGSQTVDLKVDIARRAVVVDTQPRRITVTLDQIQSQQVDVRSNIVTEPPTGFERGEPQFSERQVLVTGPSTVIGEVVATQVTMDLENQRTNLEANLRLVPVDADGNEVQGVTVEPPTVDVLVEIARNENVREISVRPTIDTGSLPDGYDLQSFTYEPQTVFVSGAAAAQIPDALGTEEISLENQTTNFEITVPILLPEGRNLFILDNQNDVQVSINIVPRIITRQFENITVTTVGLADDLTAEIVPDLVSLLITGPQAELETLNSDDLQVVVDLTGLEPGDYDRAPIAFNGQVQLEADNISFSPPTIAVTLTLPAEATEAP